MKKIGSKGGFEQTAWTPPPAPFYPPLVSYAQRKAAKFSDTY